VIIMAPKNYDRCVCGKVKLRNEAAARKGLDRARQWCKGNGLPPELWPVDYYRCRDWSRWWHVTSDGDARSAYLWPTVAQLFTPPERLTSAAA
jgi:hypothetical protein